MAESSNRENAKELIFDAMLLLLKREDFENITVSRIIEESGASRSTFYRLFDDKYDFLDKFILAMLERFVTTDGLQCGNWKGRCVDFLTQASESTSFRRFLNGSKEQVYFIIKRFFATALQRAMENASGLEEVKGDLSVMAGIMTTELLDWFEDACRVPPDEVIEQTIRFIPEDYRRMLGLDYEEK